MIALLRAEVLRLTSRRLARVFAALAVAVLLLVVVRVFTLSSRDLDGAQRRAVAAAEREERRQGAMLGDFRQQCEQQLARGELPPNATCDNIELGPGQVEFDPADFYSDPRLFAKDALPSGATAVATAVAIIAFLVGASYIGAEFHHGTMQALLFWEPRRGRVLLAKALALVGVTVAFTLLMQVLVYGGLYLTAATRGSTEGVTAGLQMSVLLTVLRGLIVVSVAALLGYAVAGLARITAAAMGAGFAYFVIVENLLRGLRPGWTRFLFSENVAAIMSKRVNVPKADVRSIGQLIDGTPQFDTLWAWRGAVTLTVYLGILLGTFYVTFTRRDVT